MSKFQKDKRSNEGTSRSKTSSKNYRNKNASSKFRGKSEKEGSGYEKTEASNDYTWHIGNDRTLLDRASQISWSYQTGESIRMGRSLGSDFVTPDVTGVYASQPGIFIIRDQISCGPIGYEGEGGYRNLSTLPTYNAANSLLTTMRSKARVRNTYDAPDILMLMYAAANVYAGIAFAKRILATANMFSFQNEYMPRDLIRAQGINPDDVLKNQFLYVTQLNTIISEMNKIYIPNRMHMFQLFNERFSNYFTEGQSIKDQIYLFTPAFLNIIEYNPNTDYASWVKPFVVLPGITTLDTNGEISASRYSATNNTGFDVILAALRQMVKAIVNHDSTPDITGDMEDCFGSSERFVLSPCMPDSIALPVFDEEILETIHNMTGSFMANTAYQNYSWGPGIDPNPSFSTIQLADTNRIGTYDYFTYAASDWVKNRMHTEASFRLVDVHRDPSPEKTFAITRLRNFPRMIALNSDSTEVRVMLHFSTDIICSMEIYYLDTSASDRVWYKDFYLSTMRVTSFGDWVFNAQAFHYRPMVVVCDNDWNIKNRVWVAGETDIYAEIPDITTLDEMDRISLLSLLGAYNNA